MVFPGVLRGRPGPRLATTPAKRPRRSLSSPGFLLLAVYPAGVRTPGRCRPPAPNENDAVPSHLGCSPPLFSVRSLRGFRAAGLATPGPRSLRLGSASRGNFRRRPTAVKSPRAMKPHPPRKSRRRFSQPLGEAFAILLRRCRPPSASCCAPGARPTARRSHGSTPTPTSWSSSTTACPSPGPRATSCSTPSRPTGSSAGSACGAPPPREDPDACLGFVGLAVPSFLPSVLPAVEVGWRLARPAWGRGLATEGARASLRHAFEELELEAVISIIDPDNERSIRVAQKLGMRRGAAHVHPRTRRRLLAFEISSQDAAFSPGPS